MGFFSKLKEFFSEENIFPEIKKLTITELESWLDSHTEAIFDTASEEIKNIRTAIAQEKSQLSINLSNLEKAELKNNMIPARVKHIMQGNREIYLQRMNSLSDQISIPLDFHGLLQFTNSFDENLSKFEKSIAKNHHVMLEFFVKETTAVSTNVKNIDRQIKEIKQRLEDNKIFWLNGIKHKTKELQSKIRRREEKKKEISHIREKLESKKTEIENKENKIESLKISEDYGEFLSLTEEKDNFSLDLANLISKISHSFSEIEAAIKKYSNSRPEDKLIKCYLDDPIKTLLEDKSLDIAKTLKKIRNAVEINEIELKEKKREKTINELGKLSEFYFRDFLQRQRELTKNLQAISKEIENSIMNKEIKKLKEDVKEDKAKLAEDKIPLNKLEKDLKEIEISALESEIEDEILKNLNKQIKIITENINKEISDNLVRF